ncbi:MAG: THUMP domain-containing protein [Pseudomonadota bacterium]
MHPVPTRTYLLVSYSRGGFGRAKTEIIHILKTFGDPAPLVEKSDVMGVAIATTCLDGRDTVRRCRALWQRQPMESFEYAIKWVPADRWCSTDLESVKRLIDEEVTPLIGEHQTWAMEVHKRRWQKYHTSEIVEYLAADIDRRVDLRNPDLIVWVDILGRETAVSLLSPDEIFSLGLSQP